MKKNFWILAIGLIGIGSTVYYYWTEATTTPDWYKEASSDAETASLAVTSATASPVNPTPTTQDNHSPLAQPLTTSSTAPSATIIPTNPSSAVPSSTTIPPNPSSAVPSSTTIPPNPTSVPTPSNSLATSPKPTVKPLPGVKAIKTQVRQDTLRSGALLDLAAMESLPAGRQTELVQKLLTVMPQLRGREIYIGVNGKLIEQNGQRQLSADSKLAIGKVELPLDDVASQMKLNRSELDQMILSYLQLDQPTP